MTTATIADLPAAFKSIQFIPSVILRTELIKKIVEINELIKETQGYQPEPELVTITNRFFGYLTSSCGSNATIVRRANWILTQATIVRNRQLEFQYRNQIQSIDDYTHVLYADMVDMIATMSEKLGEYVQSHPPGENDHLTEIMEIIVETASTTKSAQNQHYYTTLQKYGQRIIDQLEAVLRGKAIGLTLSGHTLADNLNQFRHRQRTYRNRVVVD